MTDTERLARFENILTTLGQRLETLEQRQEEFERIMREQLASQVEARLRQHESVLVEVETTRRAAREARQMAANAVGGTIPGFDNSTLGDLMPEAVLADPEHWEYRYLHSDMQRRHVVEEIKRIWGKNVRERSSNGPDRADVFGWERHCKELSGVLVTDVGIWLQARPVDMSAADRMTLFRETWAKTIQRILDQMFLLRVKYEPGVGGVAALQAIERRRENLGFSSRNAAEWKALEDRRRVLDTALTLGTAGNDARGARAVGGGA